MKHTYHQNSRSKTLTRPPIMAAGRSPEETQALEVVIKCDSYGSVETLTAVLSTLPHLKIIQSGIGPINHSDLLMAKTGSGLIIGFNTRVPISLQTEVAKEHLEVRLYGVIYTLLADVKTILASQVQQHRERKESILGLAKVIRLFPGSRHGLILGCEVLQGNLVLGKPLRIIAPVGVIYQGKLDSMHIEKEAVKKAGVRQQVGIKINHFEQVHPGDLIECFEPVAQVRHNVWHPVGQVLTIT